MQTQHTQYKRSDLLKVSGRVDSATSPQFADAINAILDAGRFKIIIDMSEVEFISSAGLRVLVNAQKVCKRYNRGEIVLSNLPPKIYSAMDLAGFTTLFKIFDDVLTAVGNL
ncbi:MAG: STAS domain-containing protein [Chloroflexi bacterium]|jgi:anti-sigma B factor antagonist|nr:STAS domain-containing protein [Chloroflexota bacterium]